MKSIFSKIIFLFLFPSFNSTLNAHSLELSRTEIVTQTPNRKSEQNADGRPKVSDNILKRMKEISLEQVCGVFRAEGYPNQYEGNWMDIHPGEVLVEKTTDFSFKNDRIEENWANAKWVSLTQIRGENKMGYYTRVKALYSVTGVYFLFECGDKVLTSNFHSDFEKLWTQDVVEVFIWPDKNRTDYFEYELSPLNYELPLLISYRQEALTKWRPFLYYDSNTQTRHRTLVEGGEKVNGANIKKWIAEIFIPYKLLPPLNNIIPERGTKWRVNFYRIDYDSKNISWWAWQPIERSFHEYMKFGTFTFN